ncbi:MAG: class II glutamine amidotransferase [Betaproteobacteria bacterium RIFCSPLOWO2_02_FULL_67_26]|nr:MAG: class II glutamine amidotransferase [Betaproteobacteria bacterium RIFCSPLOWO2_02_FULL_67_26]
MCELLAMSSRRPARLTFSLETLAAHSGRTGRNRDGWGAAFYQDGDVALFREPIAAGDSPLVRFLETQGPSTTLAISHIRRATRGVVALANTQPFVREAAGRAHVFAHNGDLPGIERAANLAFDRYRPVGTTDSEHAFCALLERMRGLWDSAPPAPPLEERFAIVSQFAADLRRLGPANFFYADGDALFAHGHRRIQPATGDIAPPGLVLLSRRCVDRDEPIHASGVSVAPGFQEVLLIASVPLTAENWRPFAEGEVVAVSGGQVLGADSPSNSISR